MDDPILRFRPRADTLENPDLLDCNGVAHLLGVSRRTLERALSARFSISSNSACLSSVIVWSLGLRWWFATRANLKNRRWPACGLRCAVENLRAAHGLE